jgi:CheY-like chemotaxis protein
MRNDPKAEGPAKSALRVLVVDDNRDGAESLGLLLQLWGHDVRVAHDGAEGLEAARRYRPDCLVLDIGLPLLDGYALAQQVRREPGLERAKLIAVTAYSGEAHTRRAREAGFDYQLVKPANPSELERILTMLHEVVRLASKTEELARQNVALAGETKDLLKEVKEDIREVKAEVKQLKRELREGKEGADEEREDQ